MDLVNPKELVQEVILVAKKKASLNVSDMLIRGGLSGVFLGFAASLAVVVTARGLPAIVGAILFPFRFVMLVLLGLELAPGNFAVLPAGLAAGEVSFGRLLRDWGWVYFGNVLGSVFYALLFYWTVTNFGATGRGAVGDLLKSAAQKKTLGLRGTRRERMGDGVDQGNSLRLDGHDRCLASAGFPLHGGEDCRHVPAHHDVLCAGFRALDRQHVRRAARNDVWFSGVD